MGIFGQSTNSLSFVFSLLGTSAVIRNLGLRLTLLLFPSLCLAVIITVRELPLLWVVFGAMMLLKGFSYALNNPTKEILYQPTSSAVKYKSKSWIDIFGARGSKALGSVVTDAFSDNTDALVSNGRWVVREIAKMVESRKRKRKKQPGSIESNKKHTICPIQKCVMFQKHYSQSQSHEFIICHSSLIFSSQHGRDFCSEWTDYECQVHG